ncbi:hypothetical protein HQ545_04380 [Candidatus Woesearchaeota archaeon]|nr:hypothetical protein [Candidatus Woesearchaeota archaeon]
MSEKTKTAKTSSVKKGINKYNLKGLIKKKPSANVKTDTSKTSEMIKEDGTKTEDNFLKYIKLAMETETKGIQFYKQAKRHVNDYNMKRLIDVLLEQEYVHLAFFKAIYKAEKKGRNQAEIKAAEYAEQPDIENPLFGTKQLQEVTEHKSTIYEIFKQAIEFEEQGYDIYMDLAKKVKSAKIKKFLKIVANEELKHRDFIQMHQEAVYNTGYWFGTEHVRLET